MKKILLVAAVAGMAMVSCKKDYTCECVTTSTSGSSSSTVTTSGTTGKMTKADAEKKCNEGDASVSSGSSSTKTECTIK